MVPCLDIRIMEPIGMHEEVRFVRRIKLVAQKKDIQLPYLEMGIRSFLEVLTIMLVSVPLGYIIGMEPRGWKPSN